MWLVRLSGHNGAMNRFTLPTAARISAIESDNYRTKTFVLDARLDAVPGQFVMAWLPRFDEKPFSLVNADPVTLMITAVGPFTRLVHELQVGDRLWLRGPFGSGFRVAATQRRLALVGGGFGVAPLLWLARTQLGRAEAITPIIGARTAEDLLYAERFEALDLHHPSPLAPRPSLPPKTAAVACMAASPTRWRRCWHAVRLTASSPAGRMACWPRWSGSAGSIAFPASSVGRRTCAAPSASAARASMTAPCSVSTGRCSQSGEISSTCGK